MGKDMKKAYLKNIKREVLTEEEQELFSKEIKTLIKAKVFNRILIISLFSEEETQIVFCQKDDYINYNVTADKWGIAKITSVSSSAWKTMILDDAGEVIKSWLEKVGFQRNPYVESVLWAVETYQNKVRFEKTNRKRLNQLKHENAPFKRHKIPKDYDSFVRNEVFDKEMVLVYDKKHDSAICTGCNEEVSIKKNSLTVKHNEPVVCPCCGRTLVAKSAGKFSYVSYSVPKWSLLIQHDKDILLLRYFRHVLQYKKDGTQIIATHELFRDKFDDYCFATTIKGKYGQTQNVINGLHEYMYDRYKSSDIVCWCDYKEPAVYSCCCEPSEFVLPRTVTLYPKLDAVEKTEQFKNSMFMKYFEDKGRTVSYGKVNVYLSRYIQFPALEKFLKLGYKTLAEQIVKDGLRYSGKFLKINESSFLKMLQMNRNELKILNQLPKERISFSDVRLIQEYRGISEKDFLLLRNWRHLARFEHRLQDAMKDASLAKIFGYIEKNCPDNPELYFDYLDLRKKLEHPKKDSIMYPKDIKAAHDRYVKEWREVVDQKEAEELKQCNEKWKERVFNMESSIKYHFENTKYKIVIPKDINDFKKEGDDLNHCVYTNYFKKAAKGETTIFFIRKQEELDKAFFTLEIKDGKVIQCHGYDNKTAEFYNVKDVDEFADAFCKQLAA